MPSDGIEEVCWSRLLFSRHVEVGHIIGRFGGTLLRSDIHGLAFHHGRRLETALGPTGINRDRLSRITLPSGQVITYTTDAAGNRLSMTPPAGATAYTYDNAGQRTQLTYPNGITM